MIVMISDIVIMIVMISDIVIMIVMISDILLMTVMISNIEREVEGSKIKLFADDTTVSKVLA